MYLISKCQSVTDAQVFLLGNHKWKLAAITRLVLYYLDSAHSNYLGSRKRNWWRAKCLVSFSFHFQEPNTNMKWGSTCIWVSVYSCTCIQALYVNTHAPTAFRHSFLIVDFADNSTPSRSGYILYNFWYKIHVYVCISKVMCINYRDYCRM